MRTMTDDILSNQLVSRTKFRIFTEQSL